MTHRGPVRPRTLCDSVKTPEQVPDGQRRKVYISKMTVLEPQEHSTVKMLALFSTQPLNGELYFPGC